jgi:solute carrier family 25 carnitine/acylcarnitine transporter 20/29
MFDLIAIIYKSEGMAGFFGGVRAMMVGQAIIKALAFATNAKALVALEQWQDLPSVLNLLLAACFAGFVASFVVAPFERIKVMMQATSGVYKNELDCIQTVVGIKGWAGLLSRGLGTTLAREIPSYGLYFWIYGVLMASSFAKGLGPMAPLVFCQCILWMSSRWVVPVSSDIYQSRYRHDISYCMYLPFFMFRHCSKTQMARPACRPGIFPKHCIPKEALEPSLMV